MRKLLNLLIDRIHLYVLEVKFQRMETLEAMAMRLMIEDIEALKGEQNTSSIPYKDFATENARIMMKSAKIPEGLQQKILEIEGLKAPQNTFKEET